MIFFKTEIFVLWRTLKGNIFITQFNIDLNHKEVLFFYINFIIFLKKLQNNLN